MPPSRRFFWPAVIDRLVPSSSQTVSWSPLLVPPGMLLRLLCSGLLGPPHGPSTSSCTRSSSVRPSTVQLERCYSPSVTSFFWTDLLVPVLSPMSLIMGPNSWHIFPFPVPFAQTSLRWYPVVDRLGLLLQQQRLEILWYRIGRSGGSCTRWIVLTFPEPRVSLPPRHPRCVAQWTKRSALWRWVGPQFEMVSHRWWVLSQVCNSGSPAVLHTTVVTLQKPAASLEHQFLPNRCRFHRPRPQGQLLHQSLLPVLLTQHLPLLPVRHRLCVAHVCCVPWGLVKNSSA